MALLQQWLVRYLCKRLMQLMTSEAFILYQNVLPSSYLENYLAFQSHFSLKELILKYHHALKHSGWYVSIPILEVSWQCLFEVSYLISFSFSSNCASSPTKLLCFTRSSPLINQLPAQYPSSFVELKIAAFAHQTLHDLVFPNPSQLVVCKLSSFLSQSSIQELLKRFLQFDTAQVRFSF